MFEEKKSEGEKMELESLQLMGTFLVIFGIIMLIAMYFPKTLMGKMADLIAGLTLLGIGIIAFLKGTAWKRRRKKLD